MDNQLDIRDINNWKRTSKKQYEVYVCRPKIGTKVVNRLEGAEYVTDQNKQFVISGTRGERWAIDGEKLAKTYCTLTGERLGANILSKAHRDGTIDWLKIKTIQSANGGACNWAFHMPIHIAEFRNFPVRTSWGDVLYANRDGVAHGRGDFLVCADAGGRPNFNDMWVVNGEVFITTYDLRGFRGLGDIGTVEAPKPSAIVHSNRGNLNKESIAKYIVNLLAKSGMKYDAHKEGEAIFIDVNSRNGSQRAICVEEDEDGVYVSTAEYDEESECYEDSGKVKVQCKEDVLRAIRTNNGVPSRNNSRVQAKKKQLGLKETAIIVKKCANKFKYNIEINTENINEGRIFMDIYYPDGGQLTVCVNDNSGVIGIDVAKYDELEEEYNELGSVEIHSIDDVVKALKLDNRFGK